MSLRALGRLFHQLQGSLQLAGVGRQAVPIEGVAFGQVLVQKAGGPLAESGALPGHHPIADRDDDIQVIELDWPVRAGNVQILHIAFLVQLSLREHVADVLGDNRALPPEKLGHLLLPKPDRVALHPDFDRAGLGLIDADLALTVT